MAYGPPKYGIRTPLFMPCEPFLLGVGVVFNLLSLASLLHSLCAGKQDIVRQGICWKVPLLAYEADYPLEAPERPNNQSHSRVGQK